MDLRAIQECLVGRRITLLNPQFAFTPDDMMNPVYCKQCRTHIPALISSQYYGMCPDCSQAYQQSQALALQQQQAAQAQQAAAQQAAHQQAVAAKATKRGMLPYFLIASLVTIISNACMLLMYHGFVIKPLKDDLAKTQAELVATQNAVTELTRVVNFNADTANRNNHLYP